jgi:hypothetical protein
MLNVLLANKKKDEKIKKDLYTRKPRSLANKSISPSSARAAAAPHPLYGQKNSRCVCGVVLLCSCMCVCVCSCVRESVDRFLRGADMQEILLVFVRPDALVSQGWATCARLPV